MSGTNRQCRQMKFVVAHGNNQTGKELYNTRQISVRLQQFKACAYSNRDHLTMQWVSISATDDDISGAITNAADRLMEQLGREPDLVLAFVAAEHRSHFSTVPSLLRNHFESATLFGALCQNSIGEGREYEDQSTISLMGAVLPDVRLQLSHVDEQQLPPTYAERSLWNSTLQLTEM